MADLGPFDCDPRTIAALPSKRTMIASPQDFIGAVRLPRFHPSPINKGPLDFDQEAFGAKWDISDDDKIER